MAGGEEMGRSGDGGVGGGTGCEGLDSPAKGSGFFPEGAGGHWRELSKGVTCSDVLGSPVPHSSYFYPNTLAGLEPQHSA